MRKLLRKIFGTKKDKKFKKDFEHFKSLSDLNRFSVNYEDIYPCFDCNTDKTYFDTHYIYHTAWAARILAKTRPLLHIDISSSLYFCTLVSAFIPVKFYDYRPAPITLKNLESGHADITNLPFENESIKSLSCMHVIEHIGLGRYGDAIDPDGDLKAITELKRVLAKEGDLLIVVPLCRSPKVCYNAHRIYSYKQIIQYFDDFNLINFSLITDGFHENVFIENAAEKDADNQNYGCGCFWFKKENNKN